MTISTDSGWSNEEIKRYSIAVYSYCYAAGALMSVMSVGYFCGGVSKAMDGLREAHMGEANVYEAKLHAPPNDSNL